MTAQYMGLTPAETLEQHPALTMTQVAWVLQEVFVRGARKGEPDRRRAIELVRLGWLDVLNAGAPTAHWKVSAQEVRTYLAGAK